MTTLVVATKMRKIQVDLCYLMDRISMHYLILTFFIITLILYINLMKNILCLLGNILLVCLGSYNFLVFSNGL